MNEARLIVRNMQEFRAELAREARAVRGDGETAVKVEGYRLMRQLKREIADGAPGGRSFRQLSFLRKRSTRRKPLSRLGTKAVRYQATGRGAHLTVSFGFLRIRSSWAWVRIAQRLQEGFTADADGMTVFGVSRRTLFRRVGSGIRGKWLKKFFFLRSTTTELRTPARPIIEPFWAANRAVAVRNIISNFNRKRRGERI